MTEVKAWNQLVLQTCSVILESSHFIRRSFLKAQPVVGYPSAEAVCDVYAWAKPLGSLGHGHAHRLQLLQGAAHPLVSVARHPDRAQRGAKSQLASSPRNGRHLHQPSGYRCGGLHQAPR